MSDRMTDERLAELGALYPYPNSIRAELHRALVAERGRVRDLAAALTDLIEDVQPGLAAGNRAVTKRAEAVLAEGATT